MAQVTYSLTALGDIEKLVDFLRADNPAAAAQTVNLITEAVQTLANHPFIGRPVEHELRELVISRGKSGYLALYSYETHYDTVLILAVRHQREAGYFVQ